MGEATGGVRIDKLGLAHGMWTDREYQGPMWGKPVRLPERGVARGDSPRCRADRP